MDVDDFDPRRFEWEYPVWLVALDYAGGPVPDNVAPEDASVNYESGDASDAGKCLVVFTDEPAAEQHIEGRGFRSARPMRVPDASLFLSLLLALQARGCRGVVFDPLPTSERVFPVKLVELIDDIRRRLGA